MRGQLARAARSCVFRLNRQASAALEGNRARQPTRGWVLGVQPRQMAILALVLAWSTTLWARVDPGVDNSQVERLSARARAAMAGKDWGAAAEALEKLAELVPSTPEVQADLGLAYYSENHISEAAQAFERALRLNPKIPRAEVMLGLCYAELGRNRQAISILLPAFRNPSYPQLGKLIGLDLLRAYSGQQQYDNAIAISNELLKRHPDDPEILFQSSRLLADRSYQLMQKLMQRSPDSIWSHYASAEVHESLRQYDLAVSDYKSILETDPRFPGIHFRLGRAILQTSNDANAVDAALHEFESELAISPDNSDADYEMGEIFRRRGAFEKSIEHFSRAVQRDPDFVQAQIGLASSLMSQGTVNKAIPHLLQAVATEPQNEVAHFRLAAAYKALGDAANHEKEMATYKKLHSTEARNSFMSSGGFAVPEVTQQTIGAQSSGPQ